MSRISPKHLPEISAPLNIVMRALDESDYTYNLFKANPKSLIPSQPFTLSCDVCTSNNDIENPIWTDIDMNILDGHHKWVKSLQNNINDVFILKLNTTFDNACRLLNKIQDIYDYDLQKSAENNDDHNSFLDYVENGDLNDNDENIDEEKNSQKFIGYRKDKISYNSIIGNFFSLKPNDNTNKYVVEFDNILDTNDMGIAYKNGQNPIDILAKIWFPHVNFTDLSKKHNISDFNLKCKAIAEKAKKHGYDGIKYGDLIIQGLN